MYNILVVEDSKPILREIERLIESQGVPVNIKTTHDGNVAMELIQEFEPDILFTDIKMPIMDGITLIGRVKAIYPHIKTVIISGYGDYSLTHQALLLHVDDYIMKPVDEREFHRLFTELIEKVDSLKKEQTENRIYQLLQGELFASQKGMPEHYVLALVRAGLFQQYAPPISKERINTIMNQQNLSAGVFVAHTKLNSEKILVYDRDQLSEEQICDINTAILKDLKSTYSRVNIIGAETASDLKTINEQYAEISNQLGRLVMLNHGQLWHKNVDQMTREEYLKIKEEIDIFRNKMERIRKNKSKNDFCKEIEKRIFQWKERNYSVYVLRKYLMVIFDEVFQAAKLSRSNMEEPGTMADKLLNNCASLEGLRDNLLEYGEFMNGVWNEKNNDTMEISRQITGYMQKNLYKNLSLQDMADEFRISPSYICRVYKIYYGETPISYFNHMKIEEARRLLQEYVDMKIKDVAELLGFSDQYYFSKVFKQQFGVSPQVYRMDGK